jgi:DNA-binding MarR family transcriptional regulator
MILPLDCYCGALRQATRLITQLYEESLRPTGLTASQFMLLRVLSRFGSSRVGDLAEMLGMDQSTMTRILALMHRDIMVQKDPSANGRETRYLLTAKGKDKLEKATPLWNAAQKQVIARFGKKEAESLRELASSLTQKLSA